MKVIEQAVCYFCEWRSPNTYAIGSDMPAYELDKHECDERKEGKPCRPPWFK